MFKGNNVAKRLKAVIDNRGMGGEKLIDILDFGKTPQGFDFWIAAFGRQQAGIGFTSTELTYLTRLYEEAKKNANPITPDNIARAARFLLGTEPVPKLGVLFTWADTPQGEKYWQAFSAAKSGKDLSADARKTLENWVFAAAAEALEARK